jgi:hypothetical protein
LTHRAHGNPGSGGVTPVKPRGLAEVIDHHIQVAVVVEIAQCQAVRDADRVEAPRVAAFFESEIAPVPKGQVGGFGRRETEVPGAPLAGGPLPINAVKRKGPSRSSRPMVRSQPPLSEPMILRRPGARLEVFTQAPIVKSG